MSRRTYAQIGAAAIAFAAFLYFVAIPYGVTSPSNVGNIVLSPTFWPNIIAALVALGGIAMLLTSRRFDNSGHVTFLEGAQGGAVRLAIAGVLMAAYVIAMPMLGMVWTSMAAFFLFALLVKTRHRGAALAAALLAPLLLYAFFAHVAGVAVPQGELIRLP